MSSKKQDKKKFNLERLEDRIAPSCFGMGGGTGHASHCGSHKSGHASNCGSHKSGHGSKHC